MNVKRNVAVTILILALHGCALNEFVHKSIPIQEQITTRLEEISKIADEAVEKKIFTKADRQAFARDVMVPVITANRSYALCLRDGVCSELPGQVIEMARGIQVGINNFVSKMAITDTQKKMSDALNGALILVNSIYIKPVK